MSLRRATPADFDAIMRLERASFPTDAWSERMMREELAGAHGYYLVLEAQSGLGTALVAPAIIVGYGGLRAVHSARDADIQTIALAESVRGRGQGRALLRALLAEASARGVHDVFLEVRADNPVSAGLYLSEGFAETGRRARYYQPDNVDAIVMQLDLRAWSTAAREEIRPGEDEMGQNDPPEAGSPPHTRDSTHPEARP